MRLSGTAMRILVTGGNGFIGSVVVRKLVQQGHQVRCLLRAKSDTTRISDLQFERIIGDICNLQSIDAAIDGCEALIHLASLSNWNDINSPLMDKIVIEGSKNILCSASKIPNIKLLFVSSSAAINGSKHPQIFNEDSDCTLNLTQYRYAAAKRTVEELCQLAHHEGKHVVVVNPGEVYGPNDINFITSCNLIDFAKSWPVLTCTGGTNVVYIDDVADGIIKALFHGRSGQRYILGGDNLSVRELAALSLKIMKKQKPIMQIPNLILQSAGQVASLCRLKFPIHPAVIPYATKYWLMDNSKAKNELGLSFRNAEATLAPTIEWLFQEGHIS